MQADADDRPGQKRSVSEGESERERRYVSRIYAPSDELPLASVDRYVVVQLQLSRELSLLLLD